MNRVFVTGYGLCCGNGLDTQEYWDNCSSLKSGLRIHEPWSHLDIKIVGLVPEERFTEKEKKEVKSEDKKEKKATKPTKAPKKVAKKTKSTKKVSKK